MNKTLKKKWLRALRSGRYKQGTANLKVKKDGKLEYCCLGVLCAAAREPMTAMRSTETLIRYVTSKDNLGSTFSTRLLKKFGLTIEQHNELTGMNDLQGKSFDEIADYIEDNL